MSVRIIPRLDIKAPNLVKGICLEGIRVLGDPAQFARHYYEQGADELLYMDVVASLYQRNSILEMIERTAREIFIPLTVGGGLRSIDDIRAALRAGADKVALNTAAIARPDLIAEAATRFGSSTIVVSIEAKRKPDGAYEAYVDSGRERTGLEVVEWARRAESLGAGELIITSIDREGTGRGFDLEITRKVADAVSIPVIAGGGAGEAQHVADVLERCQVGAVGLAALLHHSFLKQLQPTQARGAPGLDSRSAMAIKPTSLSELKAELSARGFQSRSPLEAAHHG
jgi:cyclase